MHKIIVSNECGCFKRSELNNNIEESSKDEALLKAIRMRNHMSEKFCGKHKFQVLEEKDNFIISFRDEAHSSCCGTGCCS
ncbi:MAG: hypothetical protein GY932_05720 [Arcobacter sp.]|nr:hypothetical protein [Arcobacter sp.]